MKKQVIIQSISSDIGIELAKDWTKKGWNLRGTFRTYSSSLKEIEDLLAHA